MGKGAFTIRTGFSPKVTFALKGLVDPKEWGRAGSSIGTSGVAPRGSSMTALAGQVIPRQTAAIGAIFADGVGSKEPIITNASAKPKALGSTESR